MTGTDTPASSRRAAPPWPRCSRNTATAPGRGASGTTRPPSIRPQPVLLITGPPATASSTSTAFSAGEASQYEPNLVRNTAYVEHPHTSGGHNYYHLSEDLADDAIGWLQQHKAFAPDKPFFMYWASGASHGPHQVPKEWADKYKGKFDDGWDKYRERVFRRAKTTGLDSAERAVDSATRHPCFVGLDPRRREAIPATPDGGVRRVYRTRGRAGRPHC